MKSNFRLLHFGHSMIVQAIERHAPASPYSMTTTGASRRRTASRRCRTRPKRSRETTDSRPRSADTQLPKTTVSSPLPFPLSHLLDGGARPELPNDPNELMLKLTGTFPALPTRNALHGQPTPTANVRRVRPLVVHPRLCVRRIGHESLIQDVRPAAVGSALRALPIREGRFNVALPPPVSVPLKPPYRLVNGDGHRAASPHQREVGRAVNLNPH